MRSFEQYRKAPKARARKVSVHTGVLRVEWEQDPMFFDLTGSVDTNGMRGGDAGHGGFAQVGLDVGGCGSFKVLLSGSGDLAEEFDLVEDGGLVLIRARGDEEIAQLVQWLRSAADELKLALGLTGAGILQ